MSNYRRSTTFSLEFFPPKDEAGESRLWLALTQMQSLAPDFVSVTYGAGGSTRDRTIKVTKEITARTSIPTVAHLTCVGSTKAELIEILNQYKAAGIKSILALRGDPVGGPRSDWQGIAGGFDHADQLVELAMEVGGFEVGVAAFPDGHPNSDGDFGKDLGLIREIRVFTADETADDGDRRLRLLNAVRDNPERVEFIGYNTQRVRYFAFIIAGFFAGISGGLGALNFEIVTSEVVGAGRSGGYLLFTFLGGATFFFGPIIGGILMVLAFVLLSELTKAWLLYLGLLFLFMVMYAPGGIASLIMMNLRVAAFGKLKQLWVSYLALFVTGFVALIGAGAMIEMVYHLQLNSALGDTLKFMGTTLNAKGVDSWVGSIFIMLTGLGLFEVVRRHFIIEWGDIQVEIEKEIKRRETA